MVDNIKELYAQIEDTNDFIMDCSTEFNRTPKTIAHHWFCDSGFWSVPKEFRARVIELMQNRIRLQIMNA